jgi:cytoskeleton protein RodZ
VLHEHKSKLADSRSMMSSAFEKADVLPHAPRAGADLRAARERIGWSLPAMADALRIGCRISRRWRKAARRSAGNAYALGFLRTYGGAGAGYQRDRALKAETAAVNRKTELRLPSVPERGVSAGR